VASIVTAGTTTEYFAPWPEDCGVLGRCTVTSGLTRAPRKPLLLVGRVRPRWVSCCDWKAPSETKMSSTLCLCV
jgi:hypothetical protein